MTRRIALAIAFISVNFMACCCGGAGKSPVADQKNQTADDVLPPASEPPSEKKVAVKEEKKEPAQITTQKKIGSKVIPIVDYRLKFADELQRRPAPKIQPAEVKLPNIEQLLTSTVGSITVELLSATKQKITFKRRSVTGLRDITTPAEMLKMKIKVSNNQPKTVKYAPWYSVEQAGRMTDDLGENYKCWYAGQASWLTTEKPPSIPYEQSVVDVVVFDFPAWRAERFTINLSAANIGITKRQFTFTIGRNFFENPDDRLTALRIESARNAKAEEQRLEKEEDVRIAGVEKNVAKLEADQSKKIREAERQAEAEAEEAAIAKLAGVSRSNFNRLRTGMPFEDVRKILGPSGREVSSFASASTWVWREKAFGVQITVTFSDGQLIAKSIIGD